MCKADVWRFLTHWLQTEDTQNKEAPFQPFPNKQHLFVVTRVWEKERFLLIPKSRQLTLTWWACAVYLWESMFYSSRLTFFQNKKETDADANLSRVEVMYLRLPDWMKQWQPMRRTYCSLYFPRSRSEIKAIPQGADHVRGFTVSGMFLDEMAFMDETDQVLAAVKPALGKTGKFTGVSSANPSYFEKLCFDQTDQS